MKTIPLNKEELEKVFRYDVKSNVLERRWAKGGKCRAVNSSVENNGNGYVHVSFNGRTVLVHRVIFTLVNDNIPKGMQVDHIDNDKTNNNLCNLHLLSNRDNVAKSGGGLKPCFHTRKQSYGVQAKVMFGEKQHNFHFKYFKIKAESLDFCNAYNAQFGYGKPLYKARLSTHKYWRSCMQIFKDSYFNTLKECS